MAMSTEALLNRVGKRVFVEYYEQFHDAHLTPAEVVELLPREFTKKSRWSRTSKARRIIKEGRQIEAFQMIVSSTKVEAGIAKRAEQLLGELESNRG